MGKRLSMMKSDLKENLQEDDYQGTVRHARQRALQERCVKVVLGPDGANENTVREMHVCGDYGASFVEFGLSPMVGLFLRFQLEAAVLVLLLFLLQLPELVTNFDHATTRNECRAALATEYAQLVTSDPSTPQLARCGYAGLGIRHPIPQIPLFLKFASSRCYEYNNLTSSTQPVAPPIPFVQLPESGPSFCTAPNESRRQLVMSLLQIIVIVGFLLRLRRLQRWAGIADDDALYTTGDYAAMVKGLERGKPREEILDKLWQDVRPQSRARTHAARPFRIEPAWALHTVG